MSTPSEKLDSSREVLRQQTAKPTGSGNGKGDASRLGAGALQLADLLNERFVAAGRVVDNLARRGERIVSRGFSRCGGDDRVAASRVRLRADGMASWAARRLSDLHLRVGQSIYELEAGGACEEAVTAQLLALIGEIERLEDVLRRFDGGQGRESNKEPLSEIERFFDEAEPDTARSES